MEQQKAIALSNMAVGFLADGWTDVLEAMKVEQPKSKMELVLGVIWDDLCKPIWAARKNIKHGYQNMVPAEEIQSLADKLLAAAECPPAGLVLYLSSLTQTLLSPVPGGEQPG